MFQLLVPFTGGNTRDAAFSFADSFEPDCKDANKDTFGDEGLVRTGSSAILKLPRQRPKRQGRAEESAKEEKIAGLSVTAP